MKEVIIATILISILILSFAITSGYFLGKKICLDSYSDFEPQFGLWTSCRIMADGKLTPVDIIRKLDTTNK